MEKKEHTTKGGTHRNRSLFQDQPLESPSSIPALSPFGCNCRVTPHVVVELLGGIPLASDCHLIGRKSVAALATAEVGATFWTEVVGVGVVRASDRTLFRVLEWGGMEVEWVHVSTFGENALRILGPKRHTVVLIGWMDEGSASVFAKGQ
jgi:hypothetical protein